MLQGHFISMTFKDYTVMRADLISNGTSGSILFDIWVRLRGLTAPLFFTITGVVFVFLLTRPAAESYFKLPRVKKGIKRGILLLFWGYALQLNIQNWHIYARGEVTERFFAVHVLHCIGFGIIVLILLYGLFKLIKIIPYHFILGFFALLIFTLQPWVNNLEENYLPVNAPAFIQNYFHGPHSIFPIVPWLGYVLTGGMIGALFRNYLPMIREKKFVWQFSLITLGSFLFLRILFYVIDLAVSDEFYFSRAGYVFETLMKIMGLLILLMFLERKTKPKDNLFVQMGQNTLVIYIVHVIVLYGAIIGIGLRTWMDKKLTFTESIIGSLLFILTFAMLTYVQPKIKPFIVQTFRRLRKS